MFLSLTSGSDTVLVNSERIAKVEATGSDSNITMSDGNGIVVDETYSAIKTSLAGDSSFIEVTTDAGASLVNKHLVLTISPANSGSDSELLMISVELLGVDETVSEIEALLA